MGRFCTRLFAVVLGIFVSLGQPATWAQETSSHQELIAAEFDRLVELLQRDNDPGTQIIAFQAALKLEPELEKWPLQYSRKLFRGLSLYRLGVNYALWQEGRHADNLRKAVVAFGEALELLADGVPHEWARTEDAIGIAYLELNERSDLDKAIAAFEAALTVVTRESDPEQWAQIQLYLGNALFQSIGEYEAKSKILPKAIAAFEAALMVLSRERTPEDWASAQLKLGTALLLWEPRNNWEGAIRAVEAALTVFTRENDPQQWAQALNNLGSAYTLRIGGNIADNLQRARSALQKALTVTTQETMPREWARTEYNLGVALVELAQDADDADAAVEALEAALTEINFGTPYERALASNDLGVAYLHRSHGVPAENLKKAETALEAALTFRTRENSPEEWAQTQNNLGLVYSLREVGSRADNLERAIVAFQQALPIESGLESRLLWAKTEYNLGAAYLQRIRGERAENLERAIASFEAAFTVLNSDDFPRDWANTQTLLGDAYKMRIRGERFDNRGKAIAALELAATIFKREGLLREWAETQASLGDVYSHFLAKDSATREEDFQNAMEAFERALTVFTRPAFPLQWARIQNDLGGAYADRISGDHSDNVERAIAAYQGALQVVTQQDFPEGWATIQDNLGRDFTLRILGKPSENGEKAIAALESALQVRTLEARPREHVASSVQLGHVLLVNRAWVKATETFASARKAFLLLFGQGLEDVEARTLIEKAGSLFAEAAYAEASLAAETSLKAEHLTAALTALNEGKARMLDIALRRRVLGLLPGEQARLATLAIDIREWTHVLDEPEVSGSLDMTKGIKAANAVDRLAALDHLATLRRELGGLMDAQARKEPADGPLVAARALLAEGGAIVAPIVTEIGGKMIIVTATKADPPLMSLICPASRPSASLN